MHVERIFCDLAKDFDCMNHEILIAKLHFYGIWGVFIDWFKSFLTDRRQKIHITSPNSSQIFSLTGVHWNMEFPKDKFKASVVPYIYIYINDGLLAEISKTSVHCKFNSISYD